MQLHTALAQQMDLQWFRDNRIEGTLTSIIAIVEQQGTLQQGLEKASTEQRSLIAQQQNTLNNMFRGCQHLWSQLDTWSEEMAKQQKALADRQNLLEAETSQLQNQVIIYLRGQLQDLKTSNETSISW